MKLSTQALARKTYNSLPNSGFSWHKAEKAAGTLQTIRDQAVLSGDKAASSVASAALKADVKMVDGRPESNNGLDRMRLAGYEAALHTLKSASNAPVDVLLARTASNALTRGRTLPELDKLELSNNFSSEMVAVNPDNDFSGFTSSDAYEAQFKKVGGAPTVLTSLTSYVSDVYHNHRGVDGEYHRNRTV